MSKKSATIKGYELGTVPAGSSVELLDDGSAMAFLPDGSAKRFAVRATPTGIVSVVDHFPPIRLRAGKA